MQTTSASHIHQQTLKHAISKTGIGLHSGNKVDLTLLPASENHGIVFQRTDLQEQPCIPANALLVEDTMMSSNLVKEGVRIGTVEHLLGALAGMGIDNLLIQVSASEVPIMDGSAANYISLIQEAGIQRQSSTRQYLKITQPIRVEDGDKWAEFTPYDGYQLNFEIDFDHLVIQQTGQRCCFELYEQDFATHIAPARTFGFLDDIKKLQANQLALGGSLDNAIVVDDTKILNKEGLRFSDEFVRHKLLDAIGDLYLSGYPLLGKFSAYKSGHYLNNKLVRAILDTPNSFEFVTRYEQ